MSAWDTEALAAADKKYVWHPFTQMQDWCAPEHEPIILVEGQGALLRDSRGREYIDGNSSIWTNIHGHNHPRINAAIRQQLERVAHTSFLGFTNPPAIELARAIVEMLPQGTLTRVFFSDDGSTGMEAALRIVSQYWRMQGSPREQFVVFDRAYHGDTAGAAALGAADLFQQSVSGVRLPTRRVSSFEELRSFNANEAALVAAVVIEPLVQGAAGIRLWPAGLLRELRRWCDQTGALLIADEVLTGFGRTGTMFAFERENAVPDVLILGKALTGGYIPLALTVVTEIVFGAFLSEIREKKALFYGHSYTGNPLACAAALASLEVFRDEKTLEQLPAKIEVLRSALAHLQNSRNIRDVRQIGLIAGIDVVQNPGGPPPDPDRPLGARVCVAARKHGLLTRPIGDTIVFMPPFCVSPQQIKAAVAAIAAAIEEACG